jgi:hypothetical protein
MHEKLARPQPPLGEVGQVLVVREEDHRSASRLAAG